MKLKSLAALMMAGVMTLGLCACNSTTPDASDANTDPVSITTTESWDFSTGFYPAMSPATSNGTYGFTYYARNCYDTLVIREGGEFKAGLAETWDISDDGLTYTFHLKEGNSPYHAVLWRFERPCHVQPDGNRIAQCLQ